VLARAGCTSESTDAGMYSSAGLPGTGLYAVHHFRTGEGQHEVGGSACGCAMLARWCSACCSRCVPAEPLSRPMFWGIATDMPDYQAISVPCSQRATPQRLNRSVSDPQTWRGDAVGARPNLACCYSLLWLLLLAGAGLEDSPTDEEKWPEIRLRMLPGHPFSKSSRISRK
jgi:hypothetical protein